MIRRLFFLSFLLSGILTIVYSTYADGEDTTPPIFDEPYEIPLSIIVDGTPASIFYELPSATDPESGLRSVNPIVCTPNIWDSISSLSEIKPITCTVWNNAGLSTTEYFEPDYDDDGGLPADPPTTDESAGDAVIGDDAIVDDVAPEIIVTVEGSMVNTIVGIPTMFVESEGLMNQVEFHATFTDPNLNTDESGCSESEILSLGYNQKITITCYAIDTYGNDSTDFIFIIQMEDTTKPFFTSGLNDMVEYTSNLNHQAVEFDLPKALDNVDTQPNIWCESESGNPIISGDLFETGKYTTIVCIAEDDSGNRVAGNFEIQVILGDKDSSTLTDIRNENFGMMEVSKPLLTDRDDEQKPIKISGTVKNYERGTVIEFDITKPDGTKVNMATTASKLGKYTFHYELDNSKLVGTYQVKVTYQGNLVGSDSFTPTDYYDNASQKTIPNWIRTNVKWWVSNQIDDSTFIEGIQYMIKENIINILNLPDSIQISSDEIPEWVKTNAGYWTNGLTSDKEFTDAIKHLVQKGIIKV